MAIFPSLCETADTFADIFIFFFPFYREERDSWQTSAGRKVKVGLWGLDVPSISTLLFFFFCSFFYPFTSYVSGHGTQ